MIYIDGFEFTVGMYTPALKGGIFIASYLKPLGEYIEYINKNALDSAELYVTDIDILRHCPSLKYIKIYPAHNDAEKKKYDYSALYEHKDIKSLMITNQHFDSSKLAGNVDFSKINGLECLSFSHNKGTSNYDKLKNLKTLSVFGYQNEEKNLNGLIGSKILDTLEVSFSSIKSLDGIQVTNNLQGLNLTYNKKLTDISALRFVKDTLKVLEIDHCSKIEDFSVLSELTNLEQLTIWGNNKISDICFIRNMQNLQYFKFVDINILNGDLTPCLNVPYVFNPRGKRHFNIKDKDLPKNKTTDTIDKSEAWRKFYIK